MQHNLLIPILQERLEYLKDILFDTYTLTQVNNHFEIHTDGQGLSGVLVKEVAAICHLYNKSFGIYIDSDNKPYIRL